jgi:hypothetical protein
VQVSAWMTCRCAELTTHASLTLASTLFTTRACGQIRQCSFVDLLQCQTVAALWNVNNVSLSAASPSRIGALSNNFKSSYLQAFAETSKIAGLFTVAAPTMELHCNIYYLFSLSLRFWRVQYMGVMN